MRQIRRKGESRPLLDLLDVNEKREAEQARAREIADPQPDQRVYEDVAIRKRSEVGTKDLCYVVLHNVSQDAGLNPDNILENSELKSRVLQYHMPYSKLISGERQRVLVSDSPRSVGEVFRDCFYRGKELSEGLDFKTLGVLGVPVNWGIRKKDLGLLKQGAEHVFFGTHNFNSPTQLFDLSNSAQVLSFLYGSGKLKKHNYHLSSGLPADFFDLIEVLYESAGNDRDFRQMTRQSKTRFPVGLDALKDRLDLLDDETKNSVVQSFFCEYMASSVESLGGRYMDPMRLEGKNGYVDLAFNNIGFKYNQAHRPEKVGK